jgi:hypothetical protein
MDGTFSTKEHTVAWKSIIKMTELPSATKQHIREEIKAGKTEGYFFLYEPDDMLEWWIENKG